MSCRFILIKDKLNRLLQLLVLRFFLFAFHSFLLFRDQISVVFVSTVLFVFFLVALRIDFLKVVWWLRMRHHEVILFLGSNATLFLLWIFFLWKIFRPVLETFDPVLYSVELLVWCLHLFDQDVIGRRRVRLLDSSEGFPSTLRLRSVAEDWLSIHLLSQWIEFCRFNYSLAHSRVPILTAAHAWGVLAFPNNIFEVRPVSWRNRLLFLPVLLYFSVVGSWATLYGITSSWQLPDRKVHILPQLFGLFRRVTCVFCDHRVSIWVVILPTSFHLRLGARTWAWFRTLLLGHLLKVVGLERDIVVIGGVRKRLRWLPLFDAGVNQSGVIIVILLEVLHINRMARFFRVPLLDFLLRTLPWHAPIWTGLL